MSDFPKQSQPGSRMSLDDLNSADEPTVYANEIHDDNYVLNELKTLFYDSLDSFDRQVRDITTNRLDIPGTYDFNLGRHRFIDDLNTNGGTFTFQVSDTDNLSDLEGKFQVTANAGEEHIFGARERFRYVPNYEALFGMASWAESNLSTGQHYAIELSNDAGDNGYRYHFEGADTGATLTLEQFQGSTTPVDSFTVDVSDITGLDLTSPVLARGFVNWYGVGLFRGDLSYPIDENGDGDIDRQVNPTIGRTANKGDVATNQINLRIQTRVWAEAGADPVTINVCSVGALIRGNATQIDRQKPAVFWSVGGSISQYPTDNVGDAIAARVDPNRPEVVASMEPPLLQPAGSGVTMELGVYAVQRDHPDLTVNFADPDDDGADEGPSPAAQARGSTDVMQYTRDVTSIPTTTDIRADGTTGLVPDMRHLTTTIGQSGQQNSPGSTTGGESNIKRLVYDDDVVIFLPRSDPAGNTTSGTIKYLKPIFDQDW